jgi:hypothetical protein
MGLPNGEASGLGALPCGEKSETGVHCVLGLSFFRAERHLPFTHLSLLRTLQGTRESFMGRIQT